MSIAKPKAKHAGRADSSLAVDEFMLQLEHPFKAEIETLRKIILAIAPSVHEGIKWNAPSYRTTEYFATTNLRVKGGVGLILHLGAKVREGSELQIEDPMRLLTWHGKDRASLQFGGPSELDSKTVALQAILRQWIAFV